VVVSRRFHALGCTPSMSGCPEMNTIVPEKLLRMILA